ncbi:hypothetical protein D0Z70_20385 [Sphingobium terrigena]|uniref:Uncharacterized protein n=1 Tax=Sphingobium terrigena TaxID=2304063 RepID=A0A418YMJ1_9SPHN|nr:hypothetical protein D0Z70_20385 [Sphingobium terrigena]
MLDNVILKESAGKSLTTSGQRPDAVLKVLGGYQISQRRACVLIGVDPKTVRRERTPDHIGIRVVMREVAGNAGRNAPCSSISTTRSAN